MPLFEQIMTSIAYLTMITIILLFTLLTALVVAVCAHPLIGFCTLLIGVVGICGLVRAALFNLRPQGTVPTTPSDEVIYEIK